MQCIQINFWNNSARDNLLMSACNNKNVKLIYFALSVRPYVESILLYI